MYTYDSEVETSITAFLNAISDIVVKRFNANKEVQDQVQTRVLYAPKQRVLADLLDKDQNLQLPVVACYIGGITRDPNRVFNKLLGTYNSSGLGTVKNDQTPQPVDINIKVTVATRYQKDMDQIISHIIPFVNPYFTVSWRTPARPDFEIRSNVFWDGNVSMSYPFDIAATQVAKVIADLSFTFKGWMFQAIPSNSTGTIYTIDTTYNTDFSIEYPSRWFSADTSRLNEDINYMNLSDYEEFETDPEEYKAFRFMFVEIEQPPEEGGKDINNDCLIKCIRKALGNNKNKFYILAEELKEELNLNRTDPIPIKQMNKVESYINRKLKARNGFSIFVSGDY